MIRLKKKPEEKVDSATATATATTSNGTEDNSNTSNNSASDGKDSGFKLLGIGGRNFTTGESKAVGKKKTPGEIRIQKGNKNYCLVLFSLSLSFLQILLTLMVDLSPK